MIITLGSVILIISTTYILFSMYQQSGEAVIGSEQPISNEISTLPLTAAAEPVFFVQTTHTFLTHSIAPSTTGIYTTTPYQYHPLNNQTSTTACLVQPMMSTQSTVSPGPTHEVLNLSQHEPDGNNERSPAPMKTRRMGFGTLNVYQEGVFSMISDGFIFTIDITNKKAPTIPVEYRVRFERTLCQAYMRATPAPGGVLIAREDEFIIYALMVTGSGQDIVTQIKTGLEEVRAHARLRRVSTLSFS